jgi:hypothetical protein
VRISIGSWGVIVSCVLVFSGACDGGTPPPHDAGSRDAAAIDAGSRDAGSRDARIVVDSGPDAFVEADDAGSDAAAPDAGPVPDGGTRSAVHRFCEGVLESELACSDACREALLPDGPCGAEMGPAYAHADFDRFIDCVSVSCTSETVCMVPGFELRMTQCDCAETCLRERSAEFQTLFGGYYACVDALGACY